MSMEKLAHLLGVDEVEAEHGSLGVAMSVRIGKSWLATRLDEDDLGHGHARQRVLAKGLTELTDLLRIKMGRTATRKAGLDVPYPLPAYDSYQPQRVPYQQPPTFQGSLSSRTSRATAPSWRGRRS